MRISGITIPDEKHIAYALTAVYGIGLRRSMEILDGLSIPHTKKPTELTTEEENAIREKIESFTIEGELKRQVAGNIKRLKDIDSYRGSRHASVFPLADKEPRPTHELLKVPRRPWVVVVVR